MAARGLAPNRDPLGIDIVFDSIGPKPADRRFDVLNGGRKWRFARKPIANRRNDVTVRRERREHFGPILIGSATPRPPGHPATAMDVND